MTPQDSARAVVRRRARLRWLLVAFALLVGFFGAALLGRGGDRSAWTSREAPGALPAAGYDVEMSPVGTVHFARVPTRAVTLDANYNDMLVALDEGQALVATGYGGNFRDDLYAQVPGLRTGIDAAHLPAIGPGLDKERLYALRAEVHHIDPVQLLRSPGWTRADIDEISRNVGPFFANRFSRENSYSGKEPYTYYGVWELSSKVGAVYRRQDRIAAIKAVHDEMLRAIEAKLPPPAERPRVGLLMPAGPGRFTPFCLSREGFGTVQYRALGVHDAFDPIRKLSYGDGGQAGTIDIEGLLALDPDILVMPFGIYAAYQQRFADLQKALADSAIGARLKAVKSKAIYPGGTPLQGPLFVLFQLEMAAKQLYPERFGPFRADHRYPPAEQLFDRARLAAALGLERGASTP